VRDLRVVKRRGRARARLERALLGAMMGLLGRVVERRLPTYRKHRGRRR
jgi:hypothetical protein